MLARLPSEHPVAALYRDLFTESEIPQLRSMLSTMVAATEAALSAQRHGKLDAWFATLRQLPTLAADHVDLTTGCIEISDRHPLCTDERRHLHETLMGLHPWRKGPFLVHGIHIDTEWRSDWKWQRLAPHITPLHDRLVLDVGCGNGYYGWRMLGAGARRVIGLDPTLVFVMQWAALRHFIGERPLHVLPLGIEHLPADTEAFDTVFSMGVLYHRRDPLEHLRTLFGALRPGGELVVETLVLEGGGKRVLVPEGRYAQMRNVWAIPTVEVVEAWLTAAGFTRARCVDVTRTTVAEQRPTEWMTFQSLPHFLSTADNARTVEGHPAPVRGLLVAERPL